jgi:hypothetical protein
MADRLMTSKETFERYDTDSKLLTLFDYIVAIHKTQCGQITQCEIRFKTLERRKIFDKGVAGAAGLVGGFIAGALKKVIF